MTTGLWNGTPGGGVAVRVRGLRKSYGGRLAVDGLHVDISATNLLRILAKLGDQGGDGGAGVGPAAAAGTLGYEVTIQDSCRPR